MIRQHNPKIDCTHWQSYGICEVSGKEEEEDIMSDLALKRDCGRARTLYGRSTRSYSYSYGTLDIPANLKIYFDKRTNTHRTESSDDNSNNTKCLDCDLQEEKHIDEPTHNIMSDWGYCNHNGPDTWANNYPLANGPRQSPIDIVSTNCVKDSGLTDRPIEVEYSNKAKFITNTGGGWKVTLNKTGFLLQGGPLEDKYRLEQFHCHWGKDNSTGSEHTIDGNSFPCELHLVHWNCDKYATFDEAVSQEDGLCVLGVFCTLGAENAEMQKYVELLSRIPHMGDTCPMEEDIDPAAFLPNGRAYWTYPGSLTTPPCLESVTWLVFKESMEISPEQLDAFRKLLNFPRLERTPDDEFRGKILANFRPPLSLGDRTIRSCDC